MINQEMLLGSPIQCTPRRQQILSLAQVQLFFSDARIEKQNTIWQYTGFF
jgi:hypothetical protein